MYLRALQDREDGWYRGTDSSHALKMCMGLFYLSNPCTKRMEETT